MITKENVEKLIEVCNILEQEIYDQTFYGMNFDQTLRVISNLHNVDPKDLRLVWIIQYGEPE